VSAAEQSSALVAPADSVGFGARFIVAISLGSILNPINSSIIAVALVSIAQSFHIGTDTVTWLVSGLYLATAVGQPTMGRLADRLGARGVYLAGLVLVAAGGVLGFVSSAFALLVVARIVIGLGTSAAYPAALALVRRQSERLRQEAPGGVLGALAIASQVSMALGPPLGGLLLAAGGWRSIFLINLPLAAAGAAAALRWLPDDEPKEGRDRLGLWHELDLPGLALFAAALTILMFFLLDLHAPRWYLLGLAGVLGAALVRRELVAQSPFVDLRMLAHTRSLSITYVRFAVTMLVTYCFIYGWTAWLEQSRDLTSAHAGLLLMPAFIVAALASALASRRRRIWAPLVAGTFTLAAGSACLLLLHQRSAVSALLAVSLLFGLQNGLNVVANQAALYVQAPGEGIGAAAGLFRTSMYLGAIASASLIAINFGRRASDHGLHQLAIAMTIVSLVLFATTLFDRDLRGEESPERNAVHRSSSSARFLHHGLHW
jgi:MFS family permease